jgi:hypothetical protein
LEILLAVNKISRARCGLPGSQQLFYLLRWSRKIGQGVKVYSIL